MVYHEWLGVRKISLSSVTCVLQRTFMHLGLGPKRAVSAIQNYKDIEGIIKNKDRIPGVRNYMHTAFIHHLIFRW